MTKEQFEELRQRLETTLIVNEIVRRDKAAGNVYPEPPHCDECFEGCPKCQPNAPEFRGRS